VPHVGPTFRTNTDEVTPRGGLPPVVLKSHGGPSSKSRRAAHFAHRWFQETTESRQFYTHL